MTRRTVSLPFELERTVRQLQARLLTTLDRDVSFTQALNVALATAFAVPEVGSWVERARWRELLADGGADDIAGLADVADAVFEAMEEAGPSSSDTAPRRAEPSKRPQPDVGPGQIAPEQPAEPAIAEVEADSPPESTPVPLTGPADERGFAGPTIELDESSWGIRPEVVRDGAPVQGDEPSIAEVEADEEGQLVEEGETVESEPEPTAVVDSEVTHAPERPPATQPRVMTAADLEKLRRAVLGGDPDEYEEPVSKTPSPERPEPTSANDRIEPSEPPRWAPPPGQEHFAPRPAPSWGEDVSKPAPNPDYPGIDPSQWEAVEDKPKKAPAKLTYEELSKALEEAAAAYERELKDKGQKDDE